MQSNLEIKRVLNGGISVTKLSGRIDAYWSGQLLNFLSDEIRSGNYEIKFDMADVDYLSSAGIRVFLQTSKQLKELGGSCSILAVSQNVRSVFEMTGLLGLITGDDAAAAGTGKEKQELQWNKSADGLLEFNSCAAGGKGFLCSLNGDPARALKGDISEKDFRAVKIGNEDYSIGLGALGGNFKECAMRAGEFMALPGAAMYMPTDNTRVCDFSLKHENLLPEVGSIYSMSFNGNFQKKIVMKPANGKQNIAFNDILKTISAEFSGKDVFCVIIGEASQVVGVYLNKPPSSDSGLNDIFNFPDVRGNINFTTEPAYSGNLVVAAGMISKNSDVNTAEFLRSVNGGGLNGHFHAAIFSFIPLKKDCDDLNEIISRLFENSKLESVVHLINDKRPINGIGQTELKNCILWCGEINK